MPNLAQVHCSDLLGDIGTGYDHGLACSLLHKIWDGMYTDYADAHALWI